jgi:hypothetical protein
MVTHKHATRTHAHARTNTYTRMHAHKHTQMGALLSIEWAGWTARRILAAILAPRPAPPPHPALAPPPPTPPAAGAATATAGAAKGPRVSDLARLVRRAGYPFQEFTVLSPLLSSALFF